MRYVLALALWLLPPTAAAAQHLVRAPEGVRETARDISVELRDGLAVVTTRAVIESDIASPLEATVRVPIPRGAGLTALRACLRGRCLRGRPDLVGAYEAGRTGRRLTLTPLAIAASARDAITVRVAPLVAGAPFTVEVTYVALAVTRGGVVRFTLPGQRSRPGDPPVRVEATAPGLRQITVRGATGRVEVAREAVIAARLPEGALETSALSFRCGEERCLRYRVAAGPVAGTPRDVFVLHDASPSARAAAEERRVALERLAPLLEDARVTHVAFADDARAFDPRGPLPFVGIHSALDVAWAQVRGDVAAARSPLVVLLGDGTLDRSATPTLEAIARSGAELSLVRVLRWPVDPRLADVTARTLGAVVAADADPDAYASALAPTVLTDVRVGGRSLGPLRAGEERVFETHADGPAPTLHVASRHLRPGRPLARLEGGLAVSRRPGDPRRTLTAAPAAAFRAAREGVRPKRGAGLSPRLPRRASRVIVCRSGCGCELRGSVSRASLSRVRRRLEPRVRACFARARAGRPRWSGAATLALRVRYGELDDVRVEGATDPALAECLRGVPDHLADLPATDQRLEVRFPYRSEARPPPPPVPLAPSVDRLLDAIL